MKPPLSLLILLLASSVRAGTAKPAAPPEPTSAVVEEPSYYYHTNKNSWWGDVVSRRDIYLVNDIGDLNDLCYIPPAADWVTAGAKPDIEQKYLNLIWRSAYSIAQAQGRGNGARTIGTCGVNAYSPMAYLGEFSNFYVLPPEEVRKKGFNSCRMSKDFVKDHPKYASQGNRTSNAGIAVLETLNLLIKSKTPETALNALSDSSMIFNSEKFRDTIESLINDKTVTASITIKPDGYKETMPLRVYAMRTLATTERTERTAKLLALIWHDEKEPADVREGAIRAFAFVAQWAGPAIKSDENRPAMHKALYQFLLPLMMIAADEYDKRDEANAKLAGDPKAKKAQVSELGAAAQCAADMWPKKYQIKAKKGKKYDDPD